MPFPTIDLNIIVLATILNFTLDTIVFAKFKIKRLSIILTVIMTFMIPTFSMMLYAYSVNFDISKTITPFGDWITTYMINLMAWVISIPFGLLISAIAYAVSGGRAESPW
jgi:hypothetical protein